MGMFVTDGPLAFYGPTAPLKLRMVDYLGRICETQIEAGNGVPLLVGIGKAEPSSTTPARSPSSCRPGTS